MTACVIVCYCLSLTAQGTPFAGMAAAHAMPMQQPGQQQQHVQQAPVAAAAAVADEGSEVSSLQQLCKQQLLEWRSVVELRCSDAGVVAWLLLTSSRVDKRSREEMCSRTGGEGPVKRFGTNCCQVEPQLYKRVKYVLSMCASVRAGVTKLWISVTHVLQQEVQGVQCGSE